MPVPYISLYRPTIPLLIWTLVVVVCALLLIIEVIALSVRRRQNLLLFTIIPLLAAIMALVLADRIWAAYFDIACPYPNIVSHPSPCFNPDDAAQAIREIQPRGWAMVIVTMILLATGVVLSRRARRHAATSA